MDRYIELIKKKIDKMPFGSAFVVSDFTSISDYQTAKRTLARLAEGGEIRRVIRGVYDKPSYSNLLKAIKAVGKDNISEDIILRLRERTDNLNKDTVLQEARYTTSWVFSVIKKICERVTKQNV